MWCAGGRGSGVCVLEGDVCFCVCVRASMCVRAGRNNTKDGTKFD